MPRGVIAPTADAGDLHAAVRMSETESRHRRREASHRLPRTSRPLSTAGEQWTPAVTCPSWQGIIGCGFCGGASASARCGGALLPFFSEVRRRTRKRDEKDFDDKASLELRPSGSGVIAPVSFPAPEALCPPLRNINKPAPRAAGHMHTMADGTRVTLAEYQNPSLLLDPEAPHAGSRDRHAGGSSPSTMQPAASR